MNKFFKRISNCMQGDAEECGNSSSGLAPVTQKSSNYDLHLRKQQRSKKTREDLVDQHDWEDYSPHAGACHSQDSLNDLNTQATSNFEADVEGVQLVPGLFMEDKDLPHDLWLKKRILKNAVEEELSKSKAWNAYAQQASVKEIYSKAATYMSKLKAVKCVQVPSKLMFHIEGLIALYFAASNCDNVVQAISIAVLYTQRYFTESISAKVSDTLMNLSVMDQGPTGKPDWLMLLKQAKDNWKLVLSNEGFNSLGNVISIMLSLGLCDSSNIEFNIAGMRLFSIAATKKQTCAIDLVDAVFETVSFFVEGGYQCFMEGSLSPLLSGNIDMKDLESRISACERNAEFAKTGDLEKRAGISVSDFDTELREVIDKLTTTIQTCSSEYIKRLLRDKLEKLKKVQTVFFQTRVQGGLREAPFAMTFFGSSGVGKSCVSNILMITTLVFNGFSANDDRLITVNDKDKFMSNLRSNINGIFFDDVNNTKAEFLEVAPTSRIIEFVNNVRAYANMAEVEMKGKVSIEPKVCCFTTNTKTMGAEQFSNEPASITRRSNFTATVTVKPEFAKNGMLCYEQVAAYYGGPEKIPIIPDLWHITVERSFPVPNPTPGKPDMVGYEIVNYQDPELGYIFMENICIDILIRFANHTSAAHFKQQRNFVENSNNLAEKLCFCEKCRFPGTMCICTPLDPIQDSMSDEEDQAGQYLAYAALQAYGRFFKPHVSKFDAYLQYFEEKTTDFAVARLEELMRSPYTCWTNYIPTGMMDNTFIQQAILAYNEKELRAKLRSLYFIHSVIIMFGIYIYTSGLPFLGWLLCLYSFYVMYNGIQAEKARIFATVAKDNESMPYIFKQYRDNYISYICGGSALIAILYIIIQAWKFSRWIAVEEQGNLQPTSISDVAARDAESHIEEEIANEFNWVTKTVDPIPCSEKASTTTMEQLEAKIEKNLAFMHFQRNGGMNACDIFFVKSNVALIPKHMWMDEELHVTILRKSRNVIGPNFQTKLSRTYSVDIPNHDLSLVWVPNGGSWTDLSEYLPLHSYRKINGKMIYKRLVGDEIKTIKSDLVLSPQEVGNASQRFYGAKYDLQFNTFVGLCMGTIISNARQSIIAGFHLGGMTGKPHGVCGTIYKSEFDLAFKLLGDKPGVVLSTSEGVLPTKLYGKDIVVDQSIHPKSPINKLPKEAHISVFGTCTGRATYYSDVRKSCISDIVEKVCDVKNEYDKPKFHLGKAWEESLKHSSCPSVGVEGNLLSTAVKDYVSPLIERIDNIPELHTYIRPLTRMETLCGIDGLRFVDKIPPNTSIGAPLSGPKSKYITLLDPEEYPDFACPAELDPMFWDHFEECKKEMLAGRRVYFPFKACLKDEPTKITKDKVRVFQAAPIVLQLFIRMYFLPIVRLLSLFPLDSECAVGINTVGPEFNELVEHMRKHGADRILAGDYSKYDLRMPLQLIMAAFDVLIQMADHYGYSEEDIAVMKAIATEVSSPLMMYNGDLVMHYGSNPSGQNLTVYINSIVNSLLMRCCFFSIYSEDNNFRTAASMMTYGDDVKGSVSEKFDKFNHLTYAKWLLEHDMVFTMPDKTSTPTKYMLDEVADFLKRRNVWNHYLNMWFGALDESSIWKSLMSNLASKVLTPQEQAQQNIDGAMREWFFHGEDKYEQRREQMKEVAREAGIAHGCVLLDKDYKYMLHEYCTRYNLPIPDSCEPPVLEGQ